MNSLKSYGIMGNSGTARTSQSPKRLKSLIKNMRFQTRKVSKSSYLLVKFLQRVSMAEFPQRFWHGAKMNSHLCKKKVLATFSLQEILIEQIRMILAKKTSHDILII